MIGLRGAPAVVIEVSRIVWITVLLWLLGVLELLSIGLLRVLISLAEYIALELLADLLPRGRVDSSFVVSSVHALLANRQFLALPHLRLLDDKFVLEPVFGQVR